MDEVLAIALRSLQGDMARVEQIGMNIANGLTPGYKRGVAAQAPMGASFAAHLAGAQASAGGGVGAVSFHTDARAGTFKATGQPLDLALGGKGYFEVMTPEGPAYTRLGSFRLDAAGRLVTQQGYPVMGQGGEIVLKDGQPRINSAGAVVVEGTSEQAPLARLKVVQFDEGDVPLRRGDGLFGAAAPLRELASGDVQVRQGYLENANVSNTVEMTQLVRAMRHFESMNKVAQGYDDMLGTAIRKLGETN